MGLITARFGRIIRDGFVIDGSTIFSREISVAALASANLTHVCVNSP